MQPAFSSVSRYAWEAAHPEQLAHGVCRTAVKLPLAGRSSTAHEIVQVVTREPCTPDIVSLIRTGATFGKRAMIRAKSMS